jgi:deoxyribonuclease-1
MKKFSLFLALTLASIYAYAGGNEQNDSFIVAKKELMEIYKSNPNPKTIYCEAGFDQRKKIYLPKGVEIDKYRNRVRVEFEHVVPAENFGRAFSEWREGHAQCSSSKGKKYKGRKCAEKMNQEYRLMSSDMNNLYPSVGSVNARRSNYNFTMLPTATSEFGTCDMRFEGRKVQPPENSRGIIARSYFYMDQTYPKYSMSKQQKQLFAVWDKSYPVDEWECKRAALIELYQKNVNQVVKSRCTNKGLWP